MVTIEAWQGYSNTCHMNFSRLGFWLGHPISSVKENTRYGSHTSVSLESMEVPQHRFFITITVLQTVESDIQTCLTVGIIWAWICCFHLYCVDAKCTYCHMQLLLEVHNPWLDTFVSRGLVYARSVCLNAHFKWFFIVFAAVIVISLIFYCLSIMKGAFRGTSAVCHCHCFSFRFSQCWTLTCS